MEIIQIISYIIGVIDINLSNFTDDLLYYAFAPYIYIFHDFFWGMFFGFIGGAIYVASEGNYLLIFGYLVLMGFFFGIILPFALVAIVGLIAAFIGATIVYRAFVETKSK